jgi:4-hydroxy-4-methyl-2-oxoglutarate aldolase
MTRTTDAAAIDPAARELVSSALVADALDAIGYRDQCLSPAIAPLDPEMRVMGRAFTVQVEVAAEVPEEPYVGLLRALDALGRDHVYVIPTGGDLRAAMWGELVATSARARGAVGAVTDGAIRDTRQLSDLGFPTFATAHTPRDVNGRFDVTAHQVPVEIGGIRVQPDDLIIGDRDGVVVVPALVEERVIAAALAKARTENTVRDELAAGTLPSEAFSRHGVL